jgi:hypothetical protein
MVEKYPRRRSPSPTRSQVLAPTLWALAQRYPKRQKRVPVQAVADAAGARPDSPGSTRTRERNMFDERRDSKVSSHPGLSTKPKILIPIPSLRRPTFHQLNPSHIWHHLTSRRTSTSVFSTITNREEVDEIMGRW